MDIETSDFAISSLSEEEADVLFRDESPRCMQFIERQNTRVVASLPSFSALTSDFKTILDMDKAARYDRVSRDGEYFYELLSNKAYPRGVWRRVKLEALVALASPTFSGSRAEVDKAVEWELLLDVEALSKKEGKVWALSSLPETFESVALVRLSDGGKDAVICREFDLNRRQFLDESPNAFHVLKEGRTTISYVNKDTTLIGADFGSDTLTESLYPRTVKLWKRGQELSELGEPLFEGTFKDVFMSWQAQSHEPKNQLFTRFIDFFFSKKFLRLGGQGPLLPVPCDDECKVTLWKEFILLELRVDFAGFVAGSLLAAPADLFLQKGSSVLRCIFLPSATRILEGVSHTRDFVVLSVLNNVLPEVVALQPLADGSWKEIKVHVPGLGSVNLVSLWDSESDLYPNAFLMFYRDFLTPSTVFLLHDPASQPCVMIRSPSTFDASGCTAEQRFGVSKDGTVIPYFLVLPAKRENKPLKCLIDVYGGFEISNTPFYLSLIGKGWLERGGCFVLANVRGGGEMGPKWHSQALRENHQLVFDDTICVVEALHKDGISCPSKTSLMGGSNGGLTVLACMNQRPDLFGAILSQCPLANMKTYHKITCGASWVAEYGNADENDDWSFIGKYSPVQNVAPLADGAYPALLLSTSTKDDRVHPYHARMMLWALIRSGHAATSFMFEDTEGGHGRETDTLNSAKIYALEYTFLWEKLAN